MDNTEYVCPLLTPYIWPDCFKNTYVVKCLWTATKSCLCSPPTYLTCKHYGKHTLKWQVWFEDEKCRKHNVLHQFWFLTCIHSVWRGFVAAVLLIFSIVAFICKFCKRISSIRSKDLKKPMHLPAPQKMRTELIESGQKRLIKTLSVNGNIPSLTIYDLKLKCCLAPNVPQNIFFCVPQMKEGQTCMEQNEGE